MKNNRRLICVLMAAAMVILAACSGLSGKGGGALTASGTITSKSVNIAPEVSGKVAEIAADEGAEVKAGDLLFRLDDELLRSQYDQADAAVQVAKAALDAANDQLASAQTQYEITSQSANMDILDYREDAWDKSPNSKFDRPVWYFSQSEEVAAAQSVVDDAQSRLETKQAELDKTLADTSNADFVDLEKRLAQAQYTLRAADKALDVARDAAENKELKSNAQDQYDLASTNLDNIQKEYDQALNTSAADDVLEARAAVAVAQTQLDSARELLYDLLVGDESLQVKVSDASLKQAQSTSAQAQANLTQAEANLKTLDIQLEKTKVYAPIGGIVLLKNIEVGELVSAGSIVMKVGNIDQVKLTVYVPEDKYGQVSLGQDVTVNVDSFPGKSYPGKVTYIASEAEFTPSNVQTVEGRKSTVFAVEITIDNSDHDLKSGMPADVEFITP